MARRWGLPAGIGWGGTKAKQPEAQSAYENTLGLVLEMAAGADFLFGAGLLDSVQQMSLEELVIADEVFGIVTRLLRGVAVERETLAVDLIKRMGFAGSYLGDKHTRGHVRELWQARLGETGTYESWQSAGSPRLEDKARGRRRRPPRRPRARVPRGPRARVRRHHRRGRVRPLLEGDPLMTYADSCYVGKRVKLELLSPEDVRQIHEATLDVIETVGVKYHSQQALDILEANGATVDRETTVARVPAAVVEKALSTVPHEFTLGARNPEYDLPLDGEHIYISSDGCGVSYRDPVTGEVRTSRKEDLENCARVVQALDNVSATSAVVSAQDCPPETRVLHEFDACVRNSEKHSIVV